MLCFNGRVFWSVALLNLLFVKKYISPLYQTYSDFRVLVLKDIFVFCNDCLIPRHGPHLSLMVRGVKYDCNKGRGQVFLNVVGERWSWD